MLPRLPDVPGSLGVQAGLMCLMPPVQAERCRMVVGQEEVLPPAPDPGDADFEPAPALAEAVAAVEVPGNFMFDAASHRDFLGAALGTGIDRSKVWAPASWAGCSVRPPGWSVPRFHRHSNSCSRQTAAAGHCPDAAGPERGCCCARWSWRPQGPQGARRQLQKRTPVQRALCRVQMGDILVLEADASRGNAHLFQKN